MDRRHAASRAALTGRGRRPDRSLPAPAAPSGRTRRTTFPRETIRLTFALASEAGADDAIVAAMKAAKVPPRRPIDRAVETRFWDTPEGDLARAGVGFEAGNGIGRFSVRQGPLRARTWTFDEPAEAPALRDLPAARMLPDAVRDSVLVPWLRRNGRQRMWEAMRGGIVVGVEHVVWTGAEVPIEECLLTIEGPVRASPALIDLALRLAAALPMRLLPGAREGLLADEFGGRTPAATRVPSGKLDASMDVTRGFVEIGRAALYQMLGNLGAGGTPGAADGVHQFRVGLRRLRSALRLFRDCLEVDPRRALAADLRWLNGVFADAREWDVFHAHTLAPLAATVPGASLARLVDAATARRVCAYDALGKALAGPEPTRILLTLIRWFEVGAAPVRKDVIQGALGDFAADALRRTRRRLRRRHAALSEPTAEEWHALRILVKQARYAANAFRSLYPKRAVRPYLAALERLQDSLGGANDARVAHQLAATLAAERPGEDIAAAVALVDGWSAHQQVAAREDFDRLWAAFRRAEPFWR